MGFLVFDTETTGIFDFKQPADAPGQPRLASFFGIRLDDDMQPIDRQIFYVKPDGWTIAEFDELARRQGKKPASEVNGLTDEFLNEKGVPVSEVLDFYSEAIGRGDAVVAYNCQFDAKMMRAEFRRTGRPDLFEETKQICVMRPMTDLCKIRGPYGYKWPKLAEAMAFFGYKLEGAHQADNDAEGALIIFQELHKRGLLPEAAVFYAKDKPTPASVAQTAASSSFPDAF